MSEMEEKLGQILSNPQMMQQIMSLAQAMSASQPQKQEPTPPPQPHQPTVPAIPDIDPNLLRSLSSMTRQGGIDQNQQALFRSDEAQALAQAVSVLAQLFAAGTRLVYAVEPRIHTSVFTV